MNARKSLICGAGFLIGLGAGSFVGTMTDVALADHRAKPCAKHPAKITAAQRAKGRATRAQCVRQWNRNHMAFPPAPVKWWEVKRRVSDYMTFIRIGRCEQPGRGQYGIRWDHTGPKYEGGLGFWHGTWDAWRPKHYPGNAGWASPQMQILVADAVRDDVGISAWGCA